MLHEFLTINRVALIDRCRSMVAGRIAPKATGRELEHGIPLFLDQLITTLRVEQTSEPKLSRKVSGLAGGGPPGASEIGATATLHGRELSKYGYTVDQVVHDYGDLCQAITALALETRSPIDVEEFRTLNRCLDNGIADAVTEYAFQRDSLAPDQRVLALNDRLGFFAHELRSLVHTATLAVASIKVGNVGITGATGAVLDRCLLGLRNLIDRSVADVRITAGLPVPHKVLPLSDFVAQTVAIASLEARERKCTFNVAPVDKGLAVDADLEMLLSAVAILLQNAFKFTQHGTEVLLNAYASADRILIDVEDHCGGLAPGAADNMILPFKHNGDDKPGLGLGLTICRHSVAANNGVLRVRDVPGSGCIFTIDLPRHGLS
jgi:signal transduction histidine kinase